MQFVQSYSSAGHDGFATQARAFTLAFVLTDDVSSFLVSSVLLGLLAGVPGGLSGGLCACRFCIPPRRPTTFSKI
ncbi:MAG TPA: hypothetical protein VGF67_21695 [Ktedonobacteraceae bacterium]